MPGQWPGLFLVASSSARSRSRMGMRVALVSGWFRSPLTEDVRAARGTPAPASRTPAETWGRVGSGEGGGHQVIDISRRKKEKKNVTALRVRLSPARRRGVKGRKRSRSIGSGDGGDERRSAAQALFCCCEGRRGRSSVNKRSVFVTYRMEEDAATGPSSDLIPCHHPNLQFSESR